MKKFMNNSFPSGAEWARQAWGGNDEETEVF